MDLSTPNPPPGTLNTPPPATPSPDEVVSTYAGIRPLYEDNARTNATVTRDYVFDLDTAGGPPAGDRRE